MNEKFQCLLAGNSMMTLRDNTFNELWNKGLEIIRSNGVYQKLCTDTATKYGLH